VLVQLRGLETELHAVGVTVSFGGLSPLLEASTAIEGVSKHADELVKGRTSADKQLARAVYFRFLQGFLNNVEVEVSAAKTLAHKIRTVLEDLRNASQRIAKTATSAPVRFAEIESESLVKLGEALVNASLTPLPKGASLAVMLPALQEAEQSLAQMETRLAELSEAHGGICELIKEVGCRDER
jgi:hypothetical protein